MQPANSCRTLDDLVRLVSCNTPPAPKPAKPNMTKQTTPVFRPYPHDTPTPGEHTAEVLQDQLRACASKGIVSVDLNTWADNGIWFSGFSTASRLDNLRGWIESQGFSTCYLSTTGVLHCTKL